MGDAEAKLTCGCEARYLRSAWEGATYCASCKTNGVRVVPKEIRNGGPEQTSRAQADA